MKLPLIVLFVCLATLAQSKEPAAMPAGVPAGAVLIEGNTWRWADKAGKIWLYRATPFGMMRSEESRQGSAKRPAGVPRPAGIPMDAAPMADGGWRWIDPQQKVWLFQETPSGVMKTEEPNATDQKIADDRADAVLDLVSVKEEGDSLRFSRPGPFGMYSWMKKKTQLDRDETIVWERAQAKAGSLKKD